MGDVQFAVGVRGLVPRGDIGGEVTTAQIEITQAGRLQGMSMEIRVAR
jgi:hypothetical protein